MAGAKDTAASGDSTATTDTDGTPPPGRTSRGGKRAAADTRNAKRTAAIHSEQPKIDRVTRAPDETDAGDLKIRQRAEDDSATTTPTVRDADVPASTPTRGGTDAIADEVAAPAPKLATVLRSLFSPRTAGHLSGQPEAPEASPLLWTMLAYARRQFGERTSAVAGAAAVSSTVATAGTTGDANISAASSSIPGSPAGSVVVGADGTLYQVTTNIAGSRVSVLDSNGQVITTTDFLPGNLNLATQPIARPDGTLLVVTTAPSRNRTTISAVDKQGNVTKIVSLVGATGPLTMGSNGALYGKTYITVPFIPYGTYDYRFVRISPTNTVRTLPYNTFGALAPDGSAYLLSTQFGGSTLRAIDSTGKTSAIPLPYAAADLSAPILGEDGNVYLTASVRNLFGAKSTRLYTVTGTSHTVRTLPGLAGDIQATADGVYIETYTYDGTTDNRVDGTTYISRITADTIQTRNAIDGRISAFQVTPEGTVYAPIYNPSLDNSPIAVLDPDGTLTTVTLPGKAPAYPAFNQIAGDGPHADEFGYFSYTAAGASYLAVLNPDATIARTIELPEGAVGGPVFFGPDGSPYEALSYSDAQLVVHGKQILALGADTYTPVVPVSGQLIYFQVPDIQFGPDGTGYLLTNPNQSTAIQFTGFDAAGATGVSLTLIAPTVTDNYHNARALVFAPDGTGYAVDTSADDSAVYALTPSGATKVLDFPYSPQGSVYSVGFGVDGTPYLTAGYNDGTTGFTTVTPITPLPSSDLTPLRSRL